MKDILIFISKPQILLTILAGLSGLSAYIIWIFIRQDKKIEELRDELNLSRQMYHGLKGQYDELEKAFEDKSLDRVV